MLGNDCEGYLGDCIYCGKKNEKYSWCGSKEEVNISKKQKIHTNYYLFFSAM